MGIDDKIIKQAEDACRPTALHEIGTIAKDTAISAGVGVVAGGLIASGPGVVIGGIGGAITGFSYSLNGLGKPAERCVAEHVAALEHVSNHDAPLDTPAGPKGPQAKGKLRSPD